MPLNLSTPGLDPETRRQLEQIEENKHEAEQDRLLKILQDDDKADDERGAALVKLVQQTVGKVKELEIEIKKLSVVPKKNWLDRLLNR